MPILKSVKMSLCSCSLSVGQTVLTKCVFNTLHLWKCPGAFPMIVHVNL